MLMKKQIDSAPYIGAMPVAMVAVKDGEKINFAPHGMFGQLCNDPPLIYISVLKDHLTAHIINKTQKFSVNIASTAMLEKIKYCGSISGMERDKSKEFEVFYGQSDVPMISECPVNMSCEVYNLIDTKEMYVYVGKIIEMFSNEECIIENQPVAIKVDPIICTIQGKYYRLGSEIE